MYKKDRQIHTFFWKKSVHVHTFYYYIIAMEDIHFWRRTKALMKAHNMTQKQFAEHLGISLNTVRSWIYHDRVPELSAAYAIAYAMGVSLEYLLGGKDKDITVLRLKELKLRKAAGRILKKIDKIQIELKQMRPLAEYWAKKKD